MMKIAGITIICYLFGEVFKLVILKKKKRYKYLPIVVGSFGGVLGGILYYVHPELILQAKDPITAIAIGIVSGLASTGGNELVKQMIRKGGKKDGRDI